MAYACANTINMQNGERNQNARMDARKRRVQASRRGSVLHVFSFRRRSIGIDGAGFFFLLLFVCLFVFGSHLCLSLLVLFAFCGVMYICMLPRTRLRQQPVELRKLDQHSISWYW